MKNFPIVLIVACLTMMMTACDKENINPTITPSTQITKVEKDITNFNKLVAANEFEIFLTFSATKESIEVEANENLQDLIIIEKFGQTLEIKMKENTSINGNETIKIYIFTKEIIDFKLAGEVEVNLMNDLVSDDLAIVLAGESQLTGRVSTDNLIAKMAGEAELNLKGQVANFDLESAGDAMVKDYNLICQKLDAKLAGETEVFLTITETIDISAAGESILHFKGAGKIINQSTVGEAKIIKED